MARAIAQLRAALTLRVERHGPDQGDRGHTLPSHLGHGCRRHGPREHAQKLWHVRQGRVICQLSL